MTLLWITLGVLYVIAIFTIALTTLRNGHTAMFWFGFILPILWIIGAFMQPTEKAAAAEGNPSLQ